MENKAKAEIRLKSVKRKGKYIVIILPFLSPNVPIKKSI